jgi:hypothetical protein
MGAVSLTGAAVIAGVTAARAVTGRFESVTVCRFENVVAKTRMVRAGMVEIWIF